MLFKKTPRNPKFIGFSLRKNFFWAWVKIGYLQYLKIYNSAQKKNCDVRIGLFCSIFLGIIVFSSQILWGSILIFWHGGGEWLPKNFTPLKIGEIKNWGLTLLRGAPRGLVPPPRKDFFPPLPIGKWGFNPLKKFSGEGVRGLLEPPLKGWDPNFLGLPKFFQPIRNKGDY